MVVELDSSLILESVGELCSEEVAAAVDGASKQKAIDGSSQLEGCRWQCSYCCW